MRARVLSRARRGRADHRRRVADERERAALLWVRRAARVAALEVYVGDDGRAGRRGVPGEGRGRVRQVDDGLL